MSTENSHVRKHTVDFNTYIPGYYQVLKSRSKVTTNISMEELQEKLHQERRGHERDRKRVFELKKQVQKLTTKYKKI